MGYERVTRVNAPDDGRHLQAITEDEWETVLALRAGTARVVLVPRRVHGRAPIVRCAAVVKTAGGLATCDRPLDERGVCDRASDHVESP